MRGDITAANATLVLTVEELYPGGVRLEQFATDQAWSMDEVTVAITRIGVDGQMVAGFTPHVKPVTIKLEASSPSHKILAEVYQAMEQKRGLFRCSLTADMPSIGRTVTWSQGVMVTGQPIPNAEQVLEPTTWKFEFSDIAISSM